MTIDRLYKLDALLYKKVLTVSEWAESTRYMPQTHGLFSYSQTPFLREPSAYLSDIAGTCRVVMMTPAQVGKTTMIENFLGWISEYDRNNVLLILDSLKTGQRMSKNRLRPFLRDVCGIGGSDDKQKDKSKEICNISLATGANLIIGSASSASDLCSTPAKYLLADELDRWVETLVREGDPLLLAFQRQMRFRGMALLTSTPTTEDGRIYKHFMLGTAQRWVAVCECGADLPCHYADIDFSGDTPTVSCPKCGQILAQDDVSRLRHMYTPPTSQSAYRDKFGRLARSFSVEGTLCHSFYTWGQLKKEELAAKAIGVESTRSFINTRLGEVFRAETDVSFDVSDLQRLVYRYRLDAIPKEIGLITCGIDTQDNGLALEVVGWGVDGIACGLGFHWIDGDTATSDPWIKLREMLQKKYTTEIGQELPISFSCIDSGGHRTQEVYAFAAMNRGIVCIKGYTSRNGQDPFINNYTMQKITSIGRGTGRVPLYRLGVNAGKDMLLDMISKSLAGNIVLKWTNDYNAGYTESYFDMVTAERRVETPKGGRWELLPGRRNEGLDCRIYAMAAHDIIKARKGEVSSIEAMRGAKKNEDSAKKSVDKSSQSSADVQESTKSPRMAVKRSL